MTPPEALATYLHTIHPTDTGYCELRALPGREQAFVKVGDVDGVAEFLAAHADQNCYAAVATRRTPTNGTLENCAELWTLFVDVDFRTVPEADARARLTTFPLPPTQIVHSGGGLHCYWQLREPLTLPDEAARATSLLRRLALTLGGDVASAEPARILRLPGGHNHKPVYGAARPVCLETAATDAGAYNTSELEEWLPPEPARPQGATTTSPLPFTVPSTIRDGERNAVLYRSARSLHAKGFSAAAIRAALREENAAKCLPPLPVDEVDQIAANAATQRDRDNFAAVAETPTDDTVIVAEFCPVFFARLDAHVRLPDLITELVPSIGKGMVHGHPRTLKTMFNIEIAVAAVTATPAFGLARFTVPQPLTVWYITEEDPEIEMRDRLRAFFMGRAVEPPERLHVSIQKALALDDPAWQRRILGYAQLHQPALTIIDPIRASTVAVDAGPKELQPFAAFTRTFQRDTGSVLWFGHHDTKPKDGQPDTRARPQRASGGAIFSIIESPIHAERLDDGRVLCTPSGYKFSASPEPFVIRLVADHPQHPTTLHLIGETTTVADVARLALLDKIRTFLRDHPGTSGSKICAAVHARKEVVLVALNDLYKAGEADSVTVGKAILWMVRTPDSPHGSMVPEPSGTMR